MFPLLSCPTELRLKIYAHYLEDAIIRIPGPSDALALLATCRVIYQEASPLVIPTATFSLWSLRDLLCFLATLSEAQIRALRHVVVGLSMCALRTSNEMPSFNDVLGYFPGLQLETLTVRDGFYGYEFDEGAATVYMELNRILLEGKGGGWKELRFFSPNRGILNTLLPRRGVQPRVWDQAFKTRDGDRSGASVRILVAKKLVPYTPFGADSGEAPSSTLTSYGIWNKDVTKAPPSWERVGELAPWREGEYIEYGHKRVVPRSGEMFEQRPLVVVARRGQSADCVEEGAAIPQHMKEFLATYRETREKKDLRGYINVYCGATDPEESMQRYESDIRGDDD